MPPRYQVFISHAGEDKATIAIPLRERLRRNGITAFVDEEDLHPGQDASQEMTDAMETADIGVIVMSPEFVARKWPMKELLCFLRRRESARTSGRSAPVIIPLFYRLSTSELYDEPKMDRKRPDGTSLYRSSRFYERMYNGEEEADIPTIQGALRKVHAITGIRNDVDATNGSEYVMSMRRNILLQKTYDAVVKALKRLRRRLRPSLCCAA